MEHYRSSSHTKFDIKLHFVWITKYRKPLLTGEVAIRVREIRRQICAEHEVEILKGHISKDHVHLFVSVPPHISASNLMQKIKGKSSRKILMEFNISVSSVGGDIFGTRILCSKFWECYG